MSNDSHEDLISFQDTLGDTDYGLIVDGKTGDLKGLWIPKGSDADYVPDTIVNLCVTIFGIDPEEFAIEEDDMGDPLTDSIH